MSSGTDRANGNQEAAAPEPTADGDLNVTVPQQANGVQQANEAHSYMDFGSTHTKTPDGKHLVVLRAEMLSDAQGRVRGCATLLVVLPLLRQ